MTYLVCPNVRVPHPSTPTGLRKLRDYVRSRGQARDYSQDDDYLKMDSSLRWKDKRVAGMTHTGKSLVLIVIFGRLKISIQKFIVQQIFERCINRAAFVTKFVAGFF